MTEDTPQPVWTGIALAVFALFGLIAAAVG